ncbi:MAG: shikimate dehydrogenase [Hyphomonadaceae bacterium]
MSITAKTDVLAILGDPVSHSLSPVLHNAWIQAAGLDAVYAAIRIETGRADQAFKALSAYGLRGANVTVPHKERAANAADKLDKAAKTLNAANVLRWEEDGTLSGFNTDAGGVIGALDDSHAGWRSMTGAALVIGAGGAGRAAAWGLAQAGVSRILIANRTQARAMETAALIPRAQAFAWSEMGCLFESADLIVNTTTLGMKGQPAMQWPMARAPSHAIVMDAVYAPLETPLLASAAKRGLKALDGLGMLIHQAAASFEIWFGQKPSIEMGRAAIELELAERAR